MNGASQRKFNQGTEAGIIKISSFIFVLPLLPFRGWGFNYENRYYKRFTGVIAKPDAA